MQPYSALRLLGNAVSGQPNWPRAWCDPTPAQQHEIIIISGVGHGLFQHILLLVHRLQANTLGLLVPRSYLAQFQHAVVHSNAEHG